MARENLHLAKQELERANASLVEADQRKNEFLATLAHELRNPLTPIRNSLYILRLAGKNATDRERLLDMVDRQIAHMVRLVDDLLDVSRISRGKIDLRRETIDLVAVVRDTLEVAGPLIESGGQRLELSLPPEPVLVEGDPVRLTQIVSNLLNNSAKYTDQGGLIWLSVARDGDDVTLSVRDNGSGIPAEMIPRVFDLFTQVDRTLGRSKGGLGIGLSLVKNLVEMHGGTVEARSEGPLKGSEFIVRLPRVGPARESARASEAGKEATLALSKRRILVVDDNRDAADSLAMLLRFLGADVSTAYDGTSALGIMRVHRPELVFLDIGMPGMDGYEVAAQVRRDPQYQDVTLIALTGWGQEEDRRRSRQAGMDLHLTKPLDPRVLQELLMNVSRSGRVV